MWFINGIVVWYVENEIWKVYIIIYLYVLFYLLIFIKKNGDL